MYRERVRDGSWQRRPSQLTPPRVGMPTRGHDFGCSQRHALGRLRRRVPVTQSRLAGSAFRTAMQSLSARRDAKVFRFDTPTGATTWVPANA